jgi:hypothetical protein
MKAPVACERRYLGLGFPIPQAEEIAAGYLEVNEETEGFHEGPRSFVEKRKPAWKGR